MKMKSTKKKGLLHKISKLGSDIEKIQHFASILKKAGILTGLCTFAGGIASGGVGIAVVSVGVAGLALSKILNKKKSDKHPELTDEQKEILIALLEKLIKDDCEKNDDDKQTDKDKDDIQIILNLLKNKDNSTCSTNSDNQSAENIDNDKNEDKDKDKDKKKDDLIEIILTLLKNKEKDK